uniref:Uncharacterized protein n=1 Tax=Arundo donax TaxID=35708 RepID=A0A0A9GK81_ARUDO
MEVQPRRLGSPRPRTTSYRRFTPSRMVNNLASESPRLQGASTQSVHV